MSLYLELTLLLFLTYENKTDLGPPPSSVCPIAGNASSTPTVAPTVVPTVSPTVSPVGSTLAPTLAPTVMLTEIPSAVPSILPTSTPTNEIVSSSPSRNPAIQATDVPTIQPSPKPTLLQPPFCPPIYTIRTAQPSGFSTKAPANESRRNTSTDEESPVSEAVTSQISKGRMKREKISKDSREKGEKKSSKGTKRKRQRYYGTMEKVSFNLKGKVYSRHLAVGIRPTPSPTVCPEPTPSILSPVD